MCNSNTEEIYKSHLQILIIHQEKSMCLGKEVSCVPLEIYMYGISYSFKLRNKNFRTLKTEFFAWLRRLIIHPVHLHVICTC